MRAGPRIVGDPKEFLHLYFDKSAHSFVLRLRSLRTLQDTANGPLKRARNRALRRF
ncbi:hypothetical protein BN2476_320076 [Paraburkholderia piptadeniae]|uniref:Uncharacterized protein n=1 Tax=Paraburkholderia piptadeniae TaxID=1701573 RepID=A0A1N7S4R6_9BURK|nr:hypothetical protein BN2476_320076 [Paraburkholderia piptadeniae]